MGTRPSSGDLLAVMATKSLKGLLTNLICGHPLLNECSHFIKYVRKE